MRPVLPQRVEVSRESPGDSRGVCSPRAGRAGVSEKVGTGSAGVSCGGGVLGMLGCPVEVGFCLCWGVREGGVLACWGVLCKWGCSPPLGPLLGAQRLLGLRVGAADTAPTHAVLTPPVGHGVPARGDTGLCPWVMARKGPAGRSI